MPILGVLLLVIQVLFAAHAVNTGRDRFWIYIIIFIPGIGCLVYFMTQVLPEIGQNRAVIRTRNSLIKSLDPQRELRRRREELEISDNIDNRLQLADECVEARLYEDAVSLYESCLRGIQENDPDIMLRIAQAHFSANEFQKAKDTLDSLKRLNPDYRSHDGHLLYARTLESLKLNQEAVREYEILANSYPGEEARVRFGLLLQSLGEHDRAREMFQQTLLRVKHAPKYYRQKEKHWTNIARTELN